MKLFGVHLRTAQWAQEREEGIGGLILNAETFQDSQLIFFNLCFLYSLFEPFK